MKIRGQLKSIWPDRTQYKPYSYNLEMQNVFVDIDVPDEFVTVKESLSATDEGVVYVDSYPVVLSLDGFTCLLGTIADSLDAMHINSLKTKNNR